jgi:hypothetical protein
MERSAVSYQLSAESFKINQLADEFGISSNK